MRAVNVSEPETDQLVGAMYALRHIAAGGADPAKCAQSALDIIAKLESSSAACDARTAAGGAGLAWSTKPPTEQGEYWRWDGNPDNAPYIFLVMWSGTANKCFVSIGQYGISEAIWCDDFGGAWLKIEQPALPNDLAHKGK